MTSHSSPIRKSSGEDIFDQLGRDGPNEFILDVEEVLVAGKFAVKALVDLLGSLLFVGGPVVDVFDGNADGQAVEGHLFARLGRFGGYVEARDGTDKFDVGIQCGHGVGSPVLKGGHVKGIDGGIDRDTPE